MYEVDRTISRIFVSLVFIWMINREYNFFNIDSDWVIYGLSTFVYACLEWLERHSKALDNHAKKIEKLMYPDD